MSKSYNAVSYPPNKDYSEYFALPVPVNEVEPGDFLGYYQSDGATLYDNGYTITDIQGNSPVYFLNLWRSGSSGPSPSLISKEYFGYKLFRHLDSYDYGWIWGSRVQDDGYTFYQASYWGSYNSYGGVGLPPSYTYVHVPYRYVDYKIKNTVVHGKLAGEGVPVQIPVQWDSTKYGKLYQDSCEIKVSQ